jgi:hypothetical protein
MLVFHKKILPMDNVNEEASIEPSSSPDQESSGEHGDGLYTASDSEAWRRVTGDMSRY